MRGIGTWKRHSSVSPVIPLIPTSAPELNRASVAIRGLKINTEFPNFTSLHVVPEYQAFPFRSGGLHHCSHHCNSRPHWVTPQLGTQVITYKWSTVMLICMRELMFVHPCNFVHKVIFNVMRSNSQLQLPTFIVYCNSLSLRDTAIRTNNVLSLLKNGLSNVLNFDVQQSAFMNQSIVSFWKNTRFNLIQLKRTSISCQSVLCNLTCEQKKHF